MALTPVRLFVVRHAPTDAEGICVGRASVPVSMSRDDAASRIASVLPVRPDVVHSSTLDRCLEPAAILARGLGVPHRVSEDVEEVDFGRWQGSAWAEIERKEPQAFDLYMRDWMTVAPHGGETPLEVEARVRRWRAELEPGIHLLVAHAGVVRALRVIAGSTWREAMARPVPHLRIETEL